MRVLIVNDHPALRASIRQKILGEWPGANVQEAPTLARGLALAQGQARKLRPDIVMLDLSLPDAHGLEAADRALKALHDTPILALSRRAELRQASRLLEMGVAGYLPKSQIEAELLPALHRLLVGGRFVTARLADQILGLLTVQPPP